jgi:phosphatidylglycerol:prolipoprotein diacylglycerol transferase
VYPVLFEVGGVTITTFGLMLALSFLAAGWIGSLEFDRKGYGRDVAWSLVLGALIGGILGAKLYYAFLNWPELARDPLGTLLSRAGLVWYGGLIGGALGVIYMLRKEGLPFGKVADVAALSVPIAYAVGRVGCFLVGDDYGKPTESWLGIAFPRGQPPSTAGNLRRHFGVDVPAEIPDSALLTVHPTQLYEVALTSLIFALLWRWRRHSHRSGWLFGLYLLLAGLERAFVEVFRAKDDRFFGPFTLAQLISGGLIVGGLATVWILRRTSADAAAQSSTA